MSTSSVPIAEDNLDWQLPSRGRVGMYCLIAAEAAIFTIFVVAYIFYIGKSADRSAAERCSARADLLHGLPAVEQPDDSLRGAQAGCGKHGGLCALVAADDSFWAAHSCSERRASGTT